MAYFADRMPDTGVTAKDQMRWQEFMSDTAHQREMADLKAAGLNPVLSAGGSGASTPSGSQDSADTLALLSGITELVKASHGSSASDLKRVTEQFDGLTPESWDEHIKALYLTEDGLTPTGWKPNNTPYKESQSVDNQTGRFWNTLFDYAATAITPFVGRERAQEWKNEMKETLPYRDPSGKEVKKTVKKVFDTVSKYVGPRHTAKVWKDKYDSAPTAKQIKEAGWYLG